MFTLLSRIKSELDGFVIVGSAIPHRAKDLNETPVVRDIRGVWEDAPHGCKVHGKTPPAKATLNQQNCKIAVKSFVLGMRPVGTVALVAIAIVGVEWNPISASDPLRFKRIPDSVRTDHPSNTEHALFLLV